jgi:hypothetical protein
VALQRAYKNISFGTNIHNPSAIISTCDYLQHAERDIITASI